MNSIKYKYLIIDGNNLFWRSFYHNVNNIILKKETIYSGGIQQFISRINQFKQMFCYENSVNIYILFDNPTSTIKLRQDISNGEYKSHRLNKKSDTEIYKTISILKEVLKSYSDNFYIVNIDNCEADDLTKPLIAYINKNEDDFILCISTDMDWSRNIALGNNIHWYDYTKVYDKSQFKEEYKFDATENAVKLYKTFKGDSSDCIPIGIPYFRTEILLNIIEKYDTLENLLSKLFQSDYDQKTKNLIKAHEKQLRINYRLVDFIDINATISDFIFPCKLEKGKLKMFYKSLKLELEPWMKNEKELKDTFLQKKKYNRVR